MKHKSVITRLFILVALLFIALNSYAKEYGIYLIPESATDEYIIEFNKSSFKAKLLEKYKVIPFIKNHDVHLTLYLTSFQNKHIEDIESQLANVAKNIQIFYIETKGFSVGKSGFVMLDIKNSQSLQQLSNSIINNLAKYRDTDYPAPSWVKFYPSKLASFEKYGSPNAFSQFDPHISILAANLNTDKERESFERDFNEIIKNTKLEPIGFKVKAIGFGEVNKNGQVIKTLHIYKLNK